MGEGLPSRKTVALLNKVKRFILEEPRRLDMSVFGQEVDVEDEGNPPCGTTACIAGAACLIAARRRVRFDRDINELRPRAVGIGMTELAAEVLGITEKQAHGLFYFRDWEVAEGRGWQKRFSRRYENAADAQGRAQAAVARIDHFIATGK